MGMISETEAQKKGICMFCEQPIGPLDPIARQRYQETSLCPPCWADTSLMGAMNREDGEQLDFKLSSDKPIPIVSNGALNISWLMMHRPKVLIGCHIYVEEYGLTAKFTIIPPTREASEKIMNTMRKGRENLNRKLRPGGQRNAPSRYTL